MMAGQVDDVPRVEHAMDAVMMLTTVATRLGDRCGLVAFDREVRAVVPPGARPRPARPGHRGHVRPRAARWSRATTAGAFTETLARFRRRALLVLLTDLVEQAVGEYAAARRCR